MAGDGAGLLGRIYGQPESMKSPRVNAHAVVSDVTYGCVGAPTRHSPNEETKGVVMLQVGQTEVDFDVIVVGAGVAGCVTAYQLGKAGRSVLLIERGSAPGSKNLSGGVLYCDGMQKVFPSFLDDAPYERKIARNLVSFVNADSSVTIDYRDARLADPVNAVTVLRAKLDPWLAQQCEDVGVFVMPGVRVDELLTTQGGDGLRVVGVKAGEDELRAHVVVAADGVNSFLARNLGLRSKPSKNQVAVGVKSVIALPQDKLEQRFNLSGREGAAFALVGDCTLGVGGGGFFYTNRDSISAGVVLRLDDLVEKGLKSSDIFEHFISSPVLAPYLEDGEIIEYGSHLVAEGGYAMIGETTWDGMVVVGDAAGLTLNTGLTVRGMDLAVGSAVAAAQGIESALEQGDTSKTGLAGYRQALFSSAVGADMKLYEKGPAFLERGRMYKEYGDLLADVLLHEFRVGDQPHQHILGTARAALKRSPIGLRDLVSDAVVGGRSL